MIRLLLHAAGANLRGTLQALQTRDLFTKSRHLGAQMRVLLKKPQNQLLEVRNIQTINIWG